MDRFFLSITILISMESCGVHRFICDNCLRAVEYHALPLMQELCRNALLPGSLADEQYFLLIRLSSIRCDEGCSRYEGLPSGRAFAQTDM